MERKKLFLEAGEKGRVTADVRVPVRPETIKWHCATGAVLMNEAESNTPFDMRVVGVVPGMAYIEFSAEGSDGLPVEDMVEVHVLAKAPDDARVAMHVRHARKYHSGSVDVDRSAEEESLEASGAPSAISEQTVGFSVSAVPHLEDVSEKRGDITQQAIKDYLSCDGVPDEVRALLERFVVERENFGSSRSEPVPSDPEIKEIDGVNNADLPEETAETASVPSGDEKPAETAQEEPQEPQKDEPAEEIPTETETIPDAADAETPAPVVEEPVKAPKGGKKKK